MENEENKQPETQQEPEKKENATQSVEELIKSFNEKIDNMQAEHKKELADKDDIIRQLIMQNGKQEPEKTDDEKSVEKIIENINKRR